MTFLRPLNHPSPSITFLGATQSVSGSMHLIESGTSRFLLDCGIKVGGRDKGRSRDIIFPFDPATIDAVFLSHAHADHCGNLPNLVRSGFTGPIYCTHATRDLIAIMLADSARVHENKRQFAYSGRGGSSSLFDYQDVDDTIAACEGVEYGETVAVEPDVQICFSDAGHILGSASIAIAIQSEARKHTITFTGDLGRRGLPFVCDPSLVQPADLVICESTYGGKTHSSLEEMSQKMADVVHRTIARGGKVLIPAFSLGRTQLVLHYIRNWMSTGRIPLLPIYVDNPVAAEISDVHTQYGALLLPESKEIPVEWISSEEEAWMRSTQREPCIIIASGGMCEGGRIVPFLKNHIDDPRSTVVLVSYQAPDSLGSALLSNVSTVRFQGRIWNKWIEVAEIKGFSGHADKNDFEHLLRGAVENTPHVRLVHGEVEQMAALQSQLRDMGFADVQVPKLGDSVVL